MSFKSSKELIFFLILFSRIKMISNVKTCLKSWRLPWLYFCTSLKKHPLQFGLKVTLNKKRKQKFLTKELHLLTQLGCDDLWLPCHNLLEWVNAVSKTPYNIIYKSTFDVIKHVFQLVFESIIWVRIYHRSIVLRSFIFIFHF